MTKQKTHRFPVIIEQDEDGIYVAIVPSLRGCHTQATTLDELDRRIREAIALCLEAKSESVEELSKIKFIGIHELEIAV